MGGTIEGLVCKACWTEVFNTQAIQGFWAQTKFDFCYTTTWARIKQSAEDGCSWCGFLESVLPCPDTPDWPDTWTPAMELMVSLDEAYVVENSHPLGLNLCQLDFSPDGSSRDWHVELNLCVDDPQSATGTITARPLQTRLRSIEAYTEIKQWLDQCRTHKKCSDVLPLTNLPTRVIEVAPADSTNDPPCLRSTTGLKGSYLALSYCWGSNQNYVLTSKNIKKLMQGMEVRMLPQTILDAIEVTKQLGFQYLWVDALCIMQDFAEEAARHDMKRELATMDQVYKGATITIVAACSPSVMHGFLRDRPESGQTSFDIPCRLDSEQFSVVHVQENVVHNDESEPTNARAWTFQEALLSPRLLIFASHTLQWQCRTLTCNFGGSYHSPAPSAAPRLPSPQALLGDGGGQINQSWADIPHAVLQRWLIAVRSYSTRKSSLSSDKLPALAALAASYSLVFGPVYHAGIWARSAVQQLCWCSPDRRRFFTKPAQYRAPSWSWAALDGPVYFPSFLLSGKGSVCTPFPGFDIVEWKTHPKTASLPYGEVTGGKLTVKTVLRDAVFDPSESPTLQFKADAQNIVSDSSASEPDRRHTAQGSSDTIEENFARSVCCMAMYCSRGSVSQQMGGLMVVKQLGKHSLYRRIGTFGAEVSAFEGRSFSVVGII